MIEDSFSLILKNIKEFQKKKKKAPSANESKIIASVEEF